jgi:bifunctional non-homologous end joining protein LigD
MLATATDRLPADDSAWAFELKWDGVRAVVRVDGDGVAARSRNDLDITRAYPELQQLSEVAGLRPGAVLDGELVAFDRDGQPSFERLQQRMHVADAAKAQRLAASVPVRLLVFDLLHLGRRSLLDQAFRDRRARLQGLAIEVPGATTPPSWMGGGADVLAVSKAQRLEGVVIKRLDSAYQPGVRSKSWLKLKNVRMQEVVIGGWRPGAGRRSGAIGSLLVGVPSSAGLDYVGHVGTGFTDLALRMIEDALHPLQRESSPFAAPLPTADRRDARWVEPRLVGEIVFTEWTREGRMRHPSWRGLRPDKRVEEVVRES